MKLTKSRSCVNDRNLRPSAPSRIKKRAKVLRMPRPLLQVNNLQKRRFHSTLEVKLDESCATIRDLKNRIAVQNNLSVITLVYRGVRLEDTRRLEGLLPDLRLGPPRFAVHTGVRPRAVPGGVSVNVLSLTRKTFKVELHSLDCTLLELKEAIQGYEGTSIRQIALTYGGKQLRKDHHTLRQYNVQPGCTFQLVGRLLGGLRPGGEVISPTKGDFIRERTPATFADLENTSLLRKMQLSARAPLWRVCKEGLNVEGECKNKDCIAFEQMVIDPLGFTAFNLHADETKCPCCGVKFQPLTCAFRKCMWMFEGQKPGNVYVICDWNNTSSGNKYERFDEAADGQDPSEWRSLIITAKEIPRIKNMPSFHGNGECPICFEDFTSSTSQLFAVKCKHAFHSECLTAWQRKGNMTCPMCRGSLE